MAKILISSLGKGIKGGSYNVAKYVMNGDEKIYESSSVAKVLVDALNIDKLFLLGTSGSAWDMIADSFGGDDELSLPLMDKVEHSSVSQDDLASLNKVIDSHLHTTGSKSWIIDYGINEDELWNNFSILLDMSRMINDGDEVYLDITHAFRSLPMMSFVMTEFASQVSDIDFKLSGIYYGMFEYSNDPKNTKGTTPIVDISIIYELHRWIRAIDAMKNYGNLDPLVKLLDSGSKEEKEVEKVFVQLNNNIKIANLASIQQFVSTASSKINALKRSDNKIIKLLSNDIEEFVERLNKEKMSDFQFELAKWFYDNKQYAMSYMALAEAVVTKTCEYKGYDPLTEEGRKKAKSHIDTPYDSFFSATKKVKGKVVANEGSISDIRNNIAHQLTNRKDFVKQDIARLGKYLAEFEIYMSK